VLSLWQIPSETKRKKDKDSGNSADFSAFFSLSLSRSRSLSLSISAPVHKAALLVRVPPQVRKERNEGERRGREEGPRRKQRSLGFLLARTQLTRLSCRLEERSCRRMLMDDGAALREGERKRERVEKKSARATVPLFVSRATKRKRKTCLLLTLSLSLSAESPSLGKNAAAAALLRHCGGFGLSRRRNRRKTVGREEGKVSLCSSRVWLQVGSGDR